MAEWPTDEQFEALVTAGDGRSRAAQVNSIYCEAICARASEAEKDKEIEALEQANATQAGIIKELADYVEKRAGHEENCRGWRRPLKNKSAPGWKRRGEWMEVSTCTCGPGALLRRAGRLK